MEWRLAMSTSKQLSISRETSAYWRVVINNAPINLIDPDTVYELLELMNQIEEDPDLKVVVFESADPDFFLAHWDMARAAEPLKSPNNEVTDYHWINFTTRLMKARVISIAKVRGRARGAGSEFVLSCDMRFASLEKAILGQPEVGVGVTPGGGALELLPQIVGRARALEIVLGSDDFDATTAERYGWVNRAIPDEELDEFVDNFAKRLESFDKQPMSEVKRLISRSGFGLPSVDNLHESSDVFRGSIKWEGTQRRLPAVFKQGIGQRNDFEFRMGSYLGDL